MSQVSLTVLRQYGANMFTGLGACNSMPKVAQKPLAAKHASDDRYAILLKKLEDLEKVHADGKKAVRLYFDRFLNSGTQPCCAASNRN